MEMEGDITKAFMLGYKGHRHAIPEWVKRAYGVKTSPDSDIIEWTAGRKPTEEELAPVWKEFGPMPAPGMWTLKEHLRFCVSTTPYGYLVTLYPLVKAIGGVPGWFDNRDDRSFEAHRLLRRFYSRLEYYDFSAPPPTILPMCMKFITAAGRVTGLWEIDGADGRVIWLLRRRATTHALLTYWVLHHGLNLHKDPARMIAKMVYEDLLQ